MTPAYPNRSAVDSQKYVDEKHGPEKADKFWTVENRAHGMRNRYVANSALKNSTAGYCSSAQGSHYYITLAANKKIEILKELEAEWK
jgi:hypothetical protein